MCDGHNKGLRLISLDDKTGMPKMSKTIFQGGGSIAAVTETIDGEIFVADVGKQQIQSIVRGKAVVIAGHPASQALPTADGSGEVATFKWPAAIAADKDLNIFVADSLDHKIRRISRRSNTVSCVAGRWASPPKHRRSRVHFGMAWRHL